MNLPSIIIILYIIHTVVPMTRTSLHNKIQNLHYQKINNFFHLQLLCEPDAQPCTFQYGKLPDGWYEQDQKLIIPALNMRKIYERALSVKVRDWAGEQQKQEIRIEVQKDKIGIVSSKVLTEEDRSLSAVLNDEKNGFGQISDNLVLKDEYQLNWLQKNRIASFLPTLSYLDQIIESGDTLDIMRVFQFIVSDKSECSQKSAYIKKVSERLREHIQLGKTTIEKQQRITEQANEELLRLNKEKSELERSLKESGQENRQTLIKREKQLLFQRSINFSKHYSLAVVANKYLEKLQTLLKSDSLRGDKLDEIKEQIEKGQKQIEAIDQQIKELMEKKQFFQQKVAENKQKIQTTKTDEWMQNDKISSLEKSYKEYHQKSLQFQRMSKAAQLQLQKVREKLNKMSSSTDFIEERLKKIIAQIRRWKGTQNRMLDKMKDIISTLQKSQSKIKQQIKKCQQLLDKQEEARHINNQKMVVVTNPKPFINDRNSQRIPPRQQFYHLYPILQKINIFSTQWVLKYGVPSTYTFDCEPSSGQMFGYGIITAMNKGSIRVRDEYGNIFALYLGGCSVFEAVKKNFVPEIGDLVEWEGKLVVSGIANVYRARLFGNYLN